MLRTIQNVTAEPDFKLRLVFSDGEEMVVDFTPTIKQGGVFTVLGDSDFFHQVSLGEHGRYIQWPGEIDFCADALWLQGHNLSNSVDVDQNVPATNKS